MLSKSGDREASGMKWVSINMQDKFPSDIEYCIKQGALQLGEALERLHWPNGGKDSPCHEVNALINISNYLSNLPIPYYVYAEATVAKGCRVDMVACNGDTALAFEAKSFGRIHKQSEGILKDLERLKTFRPSLTNLAGKLEPPHWWDNAKSRWGIIIVSSFVGPEVRDAWLAKDEDTVKEKIRTYSKSKQSQTNSDRENDGEDSGFMKLYRAISESCRDAAFITDAKQWDSGEGWLLWAAVPLPLTNYESASNS